MTFQSPFLGSPVPSSMLLLSEELHFSLPLSPSLFQYIKTLFMLLLPYSNFLNFCKSRSFLSPPPSYPVSCATFFPTPALLLHASHPPPQPLSGHMAAGAPPQQVTELGLRLQIRTCQGRYSCTLQITKDPIFSPAP